MHDIYVLFILGIYFNTIYLHHNNNAKRYKPYDKRSFKPDVQRIPTGIGNE